MREQTVRIPDGDTEAQDIDFLWSAIDEVLIVAITDAKGVITHVNDRFCHISGYNRHELIGNTHRILNSGYHSPAFFRSLYNTIGRGQIWRGKICNRAKNGALYWVATTIIPRMDEAGRIQSYIAYRFDVTPLVDARNKMKQLARRDPLVDALNRIGFTESLMEEARQITVSGNERTMVMIDLDGFKEVNDIYGHDAGDTVLVEIVERLRQFAGQDAIIGRLGGDEFAVILEDSCPPSEIESCLKRMLALIEHPIMIGETGVSVSAGIGYTHITRTVAAVQQSLKDADLALLQAKQEGGKRIVAFTLELRSRARQHQLLMGQARRALERGEFELYYQPVIDLAKGCITFCEALLRWHHPQLGLLTPVAFSDVFSDFQMGVQLGRLVRETVVRDLAEWSENGLYDGGVALNLCVADFGADGLADELCRLTREYAVVREKVKIEITETIFLGAGRSDRVRREIDRIARAGFPVAFDDFGTGYASISHLRELPLSHIKIDRSFIANIKDDARDLAITSGLIGLAQGIHLSVVAEGVETVDQLRLLDDLGCTECQGFLFARPVPTARVPEAVKQACLVLQDFRQSCATKRGLLPKRREAGVECDGQ